MPGRLLPRRGRGNLRVPFCGCSRGGAKKTLEILESQGELRTWTESRARRAIIPRRQDRSRRRNSIPPDGFAHSLNGETAPGAQRLLAAGSIPKTTIRRTPG